MVAEKCRVSKEASSSIKSSLGAGRSSQCFAIKHAIVVIMLFFHEQQHQKTLHLSTLSEHKSPCTSVLPAADKQMWTP